MIWWFYGVSIAFRGFQPIGTGWTLGFYLVVALDALAQLDVGHREAAVRVAQLVEFLVERLRRGKTNKNDIFFTSRKLVPFASGYAKIIPEDSFQSF